MKKLLTLTVIILAFAFVPQAQASIVNTQATTSFPGTVSVTNTFLSTPVVQGELIIVCYRIGAGNRTLTMSDNLGSTYYQAASSTNSLDGHEIFLMYANAGSAGSAKITATSSGATVTTRVIAGSYTGVALTNPLDATSTNQDNGQTYVNTGKVTTSSTPGSMLLECSGNNTANTYTSLAPYTFRIASTNTPGGHRLWWADAILADNTASSSASGYISSNVSINYSSALAVFLPNSAAAPPSPTSYFNIEVQAFINGLLNIL